MSVTHNYITQGEKADRVEFTYNGLFGEKRVIGWVANAGNDYLKISHSFYFSDDPQRGYHGRKKRIYKWPRKYKLKSIEGPIKKLQLEPEYVRS